MLSLARLRKLNTAAIWLGIFCVGAAAGFLASQRQQRRMVEQLIGSAELAAVAVQAAELAELSGTRADVASPMYARLKQRLQRLQAAHPDARFVYVFRANLETGQVVFLADSAVGGAGDESQPGDLYPEAPTSPGLQQVLRTGKPATEGPLSDQFGTWWTGYAPIFADSSAGTPTRLDILGIDIDAAEWRRSVWTIGLEVAFFSWALLGIPFVALRAARRQGEQREVIRNLSEAMEQSHSAIVILDLSGAVEYANRGVCQQLGYTRRELIGREWRALHESAAAGLVADIFATARAGRSWEGEWQCRRKDGSTFPARGVVTPVRDRQGALSCFVAVFDDVSDAKRHEAELRDARDRAEAGDRAKGQFLATMSHEVRTPLNGIVGFTSLLLETPLSTEQRDYVQTIRVSAEALIQLTGDILDFARIESGKLKLELLACDPRECVEDALDLLAAKAAEKGIELVHGVDDTVPAAIITDGGRLRQVLVNLIGNAVKFTERGEVAVWVEVVNGPVEPAAAPAQPVPTVLRFNVRDTGIGIAQEHHAKLFRPFTQVDETSTRRYGGTGLGLAISRNLVRMLGGEITFSSEPGAGSTFSFTVAAPSPTGVAPERVAAGATVAVVSPPGGTQRELVRLLRSWRATVIEAAAPEALPASNWDVALFNLDEVAAKAGTSAESPPQPMPGKAIGIVPVTLASEVRAALRQRYHTLLNKPVHHEALFAALAGARGAAAVALPPTHFGFNVLAAEDNPVNQRLIQRILSTLGCNSAVVENGRLLLEELQTHPTRYDLLLLDLHMPEMDGLTALTEIRSGKIGLRAQTMWIVALTADAREEQRARGMAAGLNDYVTKPVDVQTMETALRRFRSERLSRKR